MVESSSLPFSGSVQAMPGRPIGVLRTIMSCMLSIASGEFASDGKKPGQTLLTVMPFVAHSVAAPRVKLMMPPLAD